MSRKPQTDPGALLATTHTVGDELRVRLRLARPSDENRVRAFLGRLSPETRRRRFMAAMPVVPDALVRHFTFYDPRERLVVAATAALDGEEIVGVTDVALLATGVAELGVVVDDRHQGQGVGTLLAEAAASLALQYGARHLKAELLGENRGMLRLMERLGPTVHTTEDGHTVTYVKLPRRRPAAA
jgi:RimJ/RimL family protein N-acetyltransferase